MPFTIIRQDIVKVHADAIVNTANPQPIIGSGVDSAIHLQAGPSLLEARKEIGSLSVGTAAITPGFNLPAKYVIHTVGPVWIDGQHHEEALLASCYRRSLELAKEHSCESIAFPLISTGNYGFPREQALNIAVQAFSDFLMENEMQITLVVFGNKALALSENLLGDIRSYIDDNYISEKTREEYRDSFRLSSLLRRRRQQEAMMSQLEAEAFEPDAAPMAPPMMDSFPQSADLRSMLDQLDDGFSASLLHLIDQTGKKDSEIYKKANISRKLFSKIKNNPQYQPSKATALAFAFALELDFQAAKELIGKAGYTLTHSSRFDVIVEYYLKSRNYNLFELNEVLFSYDLPLIGA